MLPPVAQLQYRVEEDRSSGYVRATATSKSLLFLSTGKGTISFVVVVVWPFSGCTVSLHAACRRRKRYESAPVNSGMCA